MVRGKINGSVSAVTSSATAARVVVFDGTTELRLGKRTIVRWRWIG